MLPHKLVQGYNSPLCCVVDRVDDVPVKNLRHLAELLRDARGDQVSISFRDKKADVFVFDLARVRAASDAILGDNGVRNAYSDDLKAIMEAKP